jgi:hypothetical protein
VRVVPDPVAAEIELVGPVYAELQLGTDREELLAQGRDQRLAGTRASAHRDLDAVERVAAGHALAELTRRERAVSIEVPHLSVRIEVSTHRGRA